MTQSQNSYDDAFERWMIKCNIEHVQKEGLEVVLTCLKAQGYFRVATAVEQACNANMPMTTTTTKEEIWIQFAKDEFPDVWNDFKTSTLDPNALAKDVKNWKPNKFRVVQRTTTIIVNDIVVQ